jgi:Ca-activated chloride channel family protein
MAGRHVARRGGGRRWALTIGVLVVVVAAAVVVVTRTGGVPLVSGGSSGCSGRAIDLTVASSPDKAALLSDLAKSYTATGPVVRNRCVKVNVTSQEPAVVGQALAAGWDPAVNGQEPDVWTPSSSSWLYLLAGLPNGKVLLEGPRRSIARSPVVIAMPRPMAEAIGWPDKTLGWAELLGLSRDPAGWAKLKHPEWGPFKLGLTPPDRSTAGLQSVLGLQTALTDKGRVDPVVAAAKARGEEAATEALQQVVLGGMVQFERSVAHYADNTDALLQQLRLADEQGKALDFLSAFPAEEQAIWAYNHGAIGDKAGEGKGTKPKVQLAAVYPTEGAPEADHPYVVLNTPRVDRDRQAAATDFLRYLRDEPAQQRFLRLGYRGIDSNRGFIGTEEDGLLTGQPSPALQPPKAEDVGRTVKTWAALGQRGVVLSIMDVSGSMKAVVPGTGKTKLQIAVEATQLALGLFGRDSEVGLWEFSRQIDGGKDWRELVPIGPMNETVNGVPRREALARAHASMRPRGDTGLYDTTLAGYKALKAKWQPDRINALVLVTDGINDDPGSLTLQQLISRLKAELDPQRPVGIIAIAYGADADIDVLKQITAVTGGTAYSSKDPRDIGKVFLQALTSSQQQQQPEQ